MSVYNVLSCVVQFGGVYIVAVVFYFTHHVLYYVTLVLYYRMKLLFS